MKELRKNAIINKMDAEISPCPRKKKSRYKEESLLALPLEALPLHPLRESHCRPINKSSEKIRYPEHDRNINDCPNNPAAFVLQLLVVLAIGVQDSPE